MPCAKRARADALRGADALVRAVGEADDTHSPSCSVSFGPTRTRASAPRIPTSGIARVKGHATVTKTRILAGHTHTARQQVVRVDREPAEPFEGHLLRELASNARKFADASDALLISDYGYGAASPDVWNAVRSGLSGIPVTLDSRYRLLQFQGITAATPNEPEVEEALRMRLGNERARVLSAGRSLLAR